MYYFQKHSSHKVVFAAKRNFSTAVLIDLAFSLQNQALLLYGPRT